MARERSRDSLFSRHDKEDDEALYCPPNAWGYCDEKQQQEQSKPRMVRFANPSTTVFHESDGDMEGDECYEKLWYTKEDYNRFARQTAQLIRVIQTMETMSKDPFYWTKNLRRIHKSFTTENKTVSNDKTRKSCMMVLMSNRVVLDERFVGMEFRVVPAIFQDFVQRRDMLLNQVFYWQKAPITDPSQRSEIIRQSSEAASRPSVSYAHYIAKVSARDIR